MIRHSERLLTALVAILLIWAPLAFGGVTPWAMASLQALSFCALALAMVAVERPGTLGPAAPPAAALAAMALLGLLQSAPVPAGLARLLSPEHARLYGAAGALATGADAPRLTLAVSSTRSAALSWAAAAACLLAAAAVGRSRVLRRWLAGAVLASGLFQVFFGARGWSTRSRTLWGVELLSNAARLRGTFVNPNHLALYLGMALPVAFAWLWWAARRARDEPRLERRVLLLAPPGLAWVTLFLGLAFSGSRGGMLAALAAVCAQGLLLPGARRRGWRAFAGLGAAVAGLAVVAAVGLREGLGRLLSTTVGDVSLGSRLDEYAAVLRLWWRFPVTGAGLGAFRDAFPLVQTPGLPGTYWHPHGDLLEVLATAGLAGLALVAAGVWLLARRLFAVLRQGSRSEDRAAALAALGALAAGAVHAAVDFGLTMPGNALTLAALMGAAATARTLDRRQLAQQHGAGEDPAAERTLDLEKMEPGVDRRRELKKRPRSGRGRPHRKHAQGGAVEP
jgi:O-antigen ligase